MSDEGLLCCPFCGGSDLNVYKGHGGNKVQCRDCGVSGVHVRIWNRRLSRISRPGSPEWREMVIRACDAYEASPSMREFPAMEAALRAALRIER